MSEIIKKHLALISVVFILLICISSNAFGTEKKRFSFGFVPQQSPAKLAELWIPFIKYLNKKSGYDLYFSTAKDIPEFEKRLGMGKYDFAYMNPYHYSVFSSSPGYRAIAKQTDKKIQGIIVCSKNSSYKDIAGLQGANLAFPSPAAFAASVLPRANLAKLGVSFTPKYVGSHDSVYITVSKGIYPAGGGIKRTLLLTDPKVSSNLRILWESKLYTPHAFAVHPRVPENYTEPIVKILLAMKNDPQAGEIMESIGFKGIEKAEDSDWDDIRDLELNIIKK